MSEDKEPILVSRIEIYRYIGEHGDFVSVEAVDTSGNQLPLIESLGLLRLAEDSVIGGAMASTEDDDG